MSVAYQSMFQHAAPNHSFEQSKKGGKIDKTSLKKCSEELQSNMVKIYVNSIRYYLQGNKNIPQFMFLCCSVYWYNYRHNLFVCFMIIQIKISAR